MKLRTMIAALALAAPLLALAGARTLPAYDVSTEEAALKSAKTFKFTTEGKPKAYPKKVAIGYFNVRYHFKETTADKTPGQGLQSVTVTTLKFSDAEYELLTNQLYAQLQARLEAEGFEVVPRDQVTGSAAYQALAGGDDEVDGGQKVRFAPTGMKNLTTFGSGPKNQGQLAGLNAELGTDAVVAAFLNVGICNVESTKKTGNRNGIYACIRGDFTRSAIDIRFIGGAKGTGDKAKPEWIARVHKVIEAYTYNKADDLVYDMALVADAQAATKLKRNFWTGDRKLDPEQEAFIGGTGEIYDDALAMAFATWEKKHGSARKAAGLERKPVVDVAASGTGPAPEAAVVAAAPAPPAPPLPELSGEQGCWFGSTANGDMLLQRGVDRDAGRIVERQVLFLKKAAPYHGASTWTVDGTTAEVVDAAGAWTAKASFVGEPWAWTGWTLQGALTTGPTFENTTTVSAGGLHTKSQMSVNGAVIASDDYTLAPLDDAACQAKLAKATP